MIFKRITNKLKSEYRTTKKKKLITEINKLLIEKETLILKDDLISFLEELKEL
jgi:hypothetical protein